jgi:hypothetical protein
MRDKITTRRNTNQEFHYANELENVTFREYGRNIQNMAKHLLTIEDKEKRSRMAITLIELMKQLNPVVGEPNDYYQKLWDHLHVMTNMSLEVEGPFPQPNTEVLVRKPRTVPYRVGDAKFKHYGKTIELLVEQAIALPTEDERINASIYLCKLMKTFVLSHSKDLVEDSVVIENLRKISNGKLILDPERVAAGNLLSINPKEILQNPLSSGSGRQQQNSGGQRNRNQRHQQHRRRR